MNVSQEVLLEEHEKRMSKYKHLERNMSDVEYMDLCEAEFVEVLKHFGLYDSIVNVEEVDEAVFDDIVCGLDEQGHCIDEYVAERSVSDGYPVVIEVPEAYNASFFDFTVELSDDEDGDGVFENVGYAIKDVIAKTSDDPQAEPALMIGSGKVTDLKNVVTDKTFMSVAIHTRQCADGALKTVKEKRRKPMYNKSTRGCRMVHRNVVAKQGCVLSYASVTYLNHTAGRKKKFTSTRLCIPKVIVKKLRPLDKVPVIQHRFINIDERLCPHRVKGLYRSESRYKNLRLRRHYLSTFDVGRGVVDNAYVTDYKGPNVDILYATDSRGQSVIYRAEMAGIKLPCDERMLRYIASQLDVEGHVFVVPSASYSEDYSASKDYVAVVAFNGNKNILNGSKVLAMSSGLRELAHHFMRKGIKVRDYSSCYPIGVEGFEDVVLCVIRDDMDRICGIRIVQNPIGDVPCMQSYSPAPFSVLLQIVRSMF